MSTNAIDLQPLPSLPIELKGEILTHCDADTLAKASSASLAFLQLASPLLYEHITFVGPEGLMKFLTLRVSQSSFSNKRHGSVAENEGPRRGRESALQDVMELTPLSTPPG